MRPARAFVALPLALRERQFLQETVETLLARFGHSIRWVRPENYHLTLAFLGECSPRLLVNVRRQLATLHCSTLHLQLVSLAPFPDSRSPCIAAIPAPSPGLFDLQLQVMGKLLKAGGPVARQPFRPHVTIGRFTRRSLQTQTLSLFLQPKRFELVQSQCSERGSVYSTLASFGLS